MVSSNKLVFQYPGSAPISFPDIEVSAGESLLINGDSGCGKTTFLHLLAGLRRPSSGTVSIDGQSTSALSAQALDQFRGQHIGIVFQQAYFIESLKMIDNLAISPYSLHQEKLNAVTTRLGIHELMSRYPHALSVGQQQRASIARAVMNTPKLILADEPTSALDNKNCKQVIELLLEEAKANDAALIIVTHDDRLRSEVSNSIEMQPLDQL